MRRMKCWISLVLVFSLCLCLAGCFDISGYLPSTQESTDDGLTTYRITVRTHSGQYLQGVGVRVFADTEKTELVWYDKTDSQGCMTFIADTFDGYVVALEDIPDGYAAADHYTLDGVENEIVLAIGLQSGVDLNTVDLKPGSGMVDLTVTASDAVEYNLSALLASKKAVALYFFDSTTTGELSTLQSAWKGVSDEVAVLALDPVDADISALTQGLSLPMAACDSAWIEALDLYEFPTLVMVDRYGIISLIHSGVVDDTEVFRDVFAFFARNDYTAEVVDNIEDIVGKTLEGTASNPYVQDGTTDLMASVTPGGMVYYSLYHVDDMILQLQSANAWILYEGQSYYPENGVITLALDVPDPFTPVSLGIGNAGSNTELFVARFSYRPGTQNNPHELDLGTFTAEMAEGDEKGLFYTYKAVKPGVLRLSCLFATEDVAWEYLMSNRSTGIYMSSSDGVMIDEVTQEQYMLLEVSANDVVEIRIGTLPDEEGLYPAGTFTMQLGYEGSGTEDPVDPVPPGTKTDFSVTVQDSYGTALSGVSVIFTDPLGSTTVITDETGTANYSNFLGGVDVTVVPLRGYTVPKTDYTLSSSTNNVTIVCMSAMEGDSTPIGGSNAYHVSTGDNLVVMNANAVNYFLFIPTEPGLYRFACGAALSYWGTDSENLTEHSGEVFVTADGFTLNIETVGPETQYILGLTGAPYATLTVTRVGDVAPDPGTYPTENYVPNTIPQAFTLELAPGQSLHYADVTGAAAELVYNSQTGFYHLGSLDGPVVYVNLGTNAPRLALANAAAAGMVICTFDENGYIESKLDLGSCVAEYARCADKTTGVYYLTADLLYILRDYGSYAGWYDPASPNYIFPAGTEINPQLAYMFCLCWAQ